MKYFFKTIPILAVFFKENLLKKDKSEMKMAVVLFDIKSRPNLLLFLLKYDIIRNIYLTRLINFKRRQNL